MRKLKLQVQMSLDGYIAGPNSEMDWMEWNWTEDINQYVTGITEPVDYILLGRNLAEGFIPTWEENLSNPEMAPFAKKMVETPKVVFTPTAIGTGMKIFTGKTSLVLEKSIPFSCGINVLFYTPVKS